MKKTKLITSLAIGAGLIATAGISAIAITSCSAENDYNPDTTTKIMEVVPNKETFEKMKESLTKVIEEMNKQIPGNNKIVVSIKVEGNTFILYQKIGSNEATMKFVFSDNDTVKLIVNANDENSEETLTVESAKKRIYEAVGLRN